MYYCLSYYSCRTGDVPPLKCAASPALPELSALCALKTAESVATSPWALRVRWSESPAPEGHGVRVSEHNPPFPRRECMHKRIRDDVSGGKERNCVLRTMLSIRGCIN